MKGLCDSHPLKWGPLPPIDVSRVAQHVRIKKGSKEGKDGEGRIGENSTRKTYLFNANGRNISKNLICLFTKNNYNFNNVCIHSLSALLIFYEMFLASKGRYKL